MFDPNLKAPEGEFPATTGTEPAAPEVATTDEGGEETAAE